MRHRSSEIDELILFLEPCVAESCSDGDRDCDRGRAVYASGAVSDHSDRLMAGTYVVCGSSCGRENCICNQLRQTKTLAGVYCMQAAEYVGQTIWAACIFR
ncbi:MAG: hypothetical protein ACLTSZ_08650 [Lachnospiraceae bacterium]